MSPEIIDQNNPKFDEEEELKIVTDCYVNGAPKKKGDKVPVKGNDKIQLLASKRGERIPAKEGK